MPDTLKVGVKATFRVQGQTVHQFESSGQRHSQQVAAAGVGEQGPVEGTDKYDYRYTGRHDHGTLPALKTGGSHGELLDALLGAKADSDAFLTGIINQEQAKNSEDRHSERPEPEPEGLVQAELDLCDAGEGAGSSRQGGALPPTTPPAAQPAKRPRP